MKLLTQRILLSNVTNEIPTRIRLFHVGENKSTKGSVFYDPSRREELMQYQNENDTRDLLPIDIAHLSLTEVGTLDAHKSYGWFRLSYLDDGIFAEDIQWTNIGIELLRNREFRFFSPAFYVDEENYITEIINFSLTNIPASLNIEPLVASRKEIMEQENEVEPAIVALEEEIEIEVDESEPELSVEEMKAAIESLSTQVESLTTENLSLKEEIESLMSEQKDEMVEELSKSGIIGDELKEWAKSLTHTQLKTYAQHTKVSQPTFPKKIETRSSGDTMSPEDKEIYRLVNKAFKI